MIVDTLIFLLSFTLCALLPFFSGRLQEAEDRGGGIYAHLSLYYALYTSSLLLTKPSLSRTFCIKWTNSST